MVRRLAQKICCDLIDTKLESIATSVEAQGGASCDQSVLYQKGHQCVSIELSFLTLSGPDAHAPLHPYMAFLLCIVTSCMHLLWLDVDANQSVVLAS
jgi:hypothetical protein